jgi:magnesium transporter
MKDIQLVIYDNESFSFHEADAIEKIAPLIDQTKNNWINIFNFKNHSQNINQFIQMHSLLNEDILNIMHLPKCEVHESYIFTTLKYTDINDLALRFFHKSFLMSQTILYSFHINNEDIFRGIRESIEQNKGRIRGQSVDYLLYMLLDVIVDSYFPVLEKFREKTEALEISLLDDTKNNRIAEIVNLKKDFMRLSKYIYPLKEMIIKLKKFNVEITQNEQHIYYNDVLDHIDFLTQSMNNFREILSDLRDLNTSNINSAINSVMQTLTVISAVFIPLTFLAGIYGMNFQWIPELNYKYGYPILMLVMFSIAVVMLYIMRRKKWF